MYSSDPTLSYTQCHRFLQGAGFCVLFMAVFFAQTAYAAPSFGSQTSLIATGKVNSLTISSPADTLIGDGLVAIVAIAGSEAGEVTISGDWQELDIGEITNKKSTLAIFGRFATVAGEQPYTFSWDKNKEAQAVILRYTDVDPINSIRVFGSANEHGINPTAPDINNENPDSGVLRVYVAEDGTTSSTPYPPGTNGRYNVATGTGKGSVTLGIADQVQLVAGPTGTAPFELSVAQHWQAVTLVVVAPDGVDHGINPLPPGDGNDALGICFSAGVDGSQTTSGVINSYYPAIASAAAGAGTITLGTALPGADIISKGDLLLIIQMQDTVIDSSDTLDYGDRLGTASGSVNINQTGLFEVNVATNHVPVTGGPLNLEDPLVSGYNHGGNSRYQVVRIPSYKNLTLNGTLTAEPWNGTAGGVLYVDVDDTLEMNGNNIDVSGQGFRGGQYSGGLATGVSQAYTAVSTPPDPYAEKGEGIAGTPSISYGGPGYPGGDLARGAPGNAGGGGNFDNSGGGGGSNIGYGGQGGDGLTTGAVGGYGGGTFNGYSGRLLLGGGGGAGHRTGLQTGPGVAGGGIAIINARNIINSSHLVDIGFILANGDSAVDALLPVGGAGGGGAGGSIIVRTLSPRLLGVDARARGGNGGGVPIFGGPGGGGAGGAVYRKTRMPASVAGGAAGQVAGANNGATSGGVGEVGSITDFSVPVGCDFPDEPLSYDSGQSTFHYVTATGGSIPELTIGSVEDFESKSGETLRNGYAGPDADADDLQDTSDIGVTGSGNDEDGVAFSFPAIDTVVATVLVNNPFAVQVTLCGWLDGGFDGTINGTYEPAEGRCQDIEKTSESIVLTWSGLPSHDTSFTTYGRFRLTSGSLDETTPMGIEADGEIETHKLSFPPIRDFGDAPLSGVGTYGNATHRQPATALLETVKINITDGANWTPVTLQGRYLSPVIVCTYNLPSAADNETVVRVRNISSSSFDVGLQQPLNNPGTPSDVYCLVAEEGVHTLPDGRQFEAHRIVSTTTSGRNAADGWNGSGEDVSTLVQGSYSSPVVLGQVMSFNNADFSVFWSYDCTNRRTPPFQGSGNICVGKHIGEGSGLRNSETLGFIVVDGGSGSFGTVAYEAALGANTVRGVDNSPPYPYALGQTYPFAVATQEAENGGDGGFAVLFGASPVTNQINLAIDEDTVGLNNQERSHTNEQVAYWAWSDDNLLVKRFPYIGTIEGDIEPGTQETVAADGDDTNDTSITGAGDDEDGVTFRSPSGTGQTIFADAVVNNPTALPVTICGWLDVPSGGTVDGVFNAGDGSCQLAASGETTMTFQWSGLPTDQAYTTYARFRVSSDALTSANAAGDANNGEVEDYRVLFDFQPTVVTIGQVNLAAVAVDDFFTGLNTDQMDDASLYALLETWDPEQAARLADADRTEIMQALRTYLDPDGDGQVAVLRWDTLEERGTVGFYVERRRDRLEWQRVNIEMLPGLITAPMGGEYQLADPNAASGSSYQYRLIEQEARGTIRNYGPFSLEMK